MVNWGYISLIFHELMHSKCSFDSSHIFFLPLLEKFVVGKFVPIRGIISIWQNNLDPVLTKILIKEMEHSNE